MDTADICVMGLGYIGLPTASLLATKGRKVHGVDVRPRHIAAINDGSLEVVEPDLDVLVRSAVNSGNLFASLEAVAADVYIIAVPTPLDGREPDLSFVMDATDTLVPHLREGALVILESTSPVGTTEKVAARIAEARPDLDGKFSVAYCPERVLPGSLLRELVDNDRVVGGVTPEAAEAAAAFYRTFVNGEVMTTDARTAEMTKLVENSFRDVNIAFANELSMICEPLDIDVRELITLANRHPRVSILRPGPGVGGHCIAVDPWFIVSGSPEASTLIRTARQVNLAKTAWVTEQVLTHAERFKRPVVACLGLAYKPDVDDLRESPALEIAEALVAALGPEAVLAVEPNLAEHPLGLHDLEDAVRRADVVVGLVAHRPFKKLDRERLAAKVVLDYCGALG